MTQQEKRIKIAEKCGWRMVHSDFTEKSWIRPDDTFGGIGLDVLPNYFSSLDACHEMEKVLNNNAKWAYLKVLHDSMKTFHTAEIVFATAAQRAEAFGITMGLWKDGE